MPRIGGAGNVWMHGIYESLCIIIVFPLIVYLGAGGVLATQKENRKCQLLGDMRYSF